jgi:redox-sensitive bicupin YhaK (pirin superfamily)
VLKGGIAINSNETINAKELILFERIGNQIFLQAKGNSTILVMNGKPIDEPIVGQGPFVMNTEIEILQAIKDYYAKRF